MSKPEKAMKRRIPLELKRSVTGLEIATAMSYISTMCGQRENIMFEHTAGKKEQEARSYIANLKRKVWGSVCEGKILGFSSQWEYMAFMIETGEDCPNATIKPDATYDKVTLVRSNKFLAEETYLSGYSEERAIEKQNQLKTCLEKVINNPPSGREFNQFGNKTFKEI